MPHKKRTNILVLLACALVLPFLAQASGVFVSDRKPSADDKRLYLLHADTWRFDAYEQPDAQRLNGHVKFRHGNMVLSCDSAVYYEAAQSFEAFGNVVLNQGDTLTLKSRRMSYRAESEIAEAREQVVLTHRGQILKTDSLNYDRYLGIAYYFEGGELWDGKNHLVSDWGEYHTQTRQSVFNFNVLLRTDRAKIQTDTLRFNNTTRWAHVSGPSNIITDNERIYTERGDYNTRTEEAHLFDRSTVFSKDGTLQADSIFYDKLTGDAEAFRDVLYTDTINKVILESQYGIYNEQTGYGLAYGRALAKEFSQGKDTLYVHADTLRLTTENIATDSVRRTLVGYYHARAYRTDMQAVADSLVAYSKDRRLVLFKDPIVWSDERQIVGEEIHAWVNDSTLDSVYVREQALMVERLDSIHYNQVAGQLLRSYFKDGKPVLNCVDGNAMVVNFPLERDSAIIYQNATETARLRMTMENGKMKRLWAPGSKGTFYVAGLAPQERTFLPSFAWFDYIRPLNKDDIFEWRPKKKGTQLKPAVRHVAPIQTIGKK